MSGQRLPLQGGLPPEEGIAGAVVEIACDESGFSGSNLLDAATPLFTHASVDLSFGEAVELIATLRSGSRFTVEELKSATFLRGSRVGELLAALAGRAHVHLIDKEYFLVTRIVDLLLLEPSYAAGTRLTEDHRATALSIYRARHTIDGSWSTFLAAFVDLVRTKRRSEPDRDAFERFFRLRDALVTAGLAVLEGLDPDRVWDVVMRLTHDDRSIPPPLEPLLPALAETVLFWSDGHRQVLVVHDEQSALTADRLRRLQGVLADGATVSPLAGLVSVDSRDDPRVQVADLLAGVARRPPDAGDGRLQPFLSSTSLVDTEA